MILHDPLQSARPNWRWAAGRRAVASEGPRTAAALRPWPCLPCFALISALSRPAIALQISAHFSTTANNNASHRLRTLKITSHLVLACLPPSTSLTQIPRHATASLELQAATPSAHLHPPPSASIHPRAISRPRSTTTLQMSPPHHTPPLLLTKRLTAFLHANQTASLPTLLLTTPHGKLLAHASPQPVSVLRTHATVAASLLSIHSSSSPVLPSALPGSRTPDPIGSSPPDEDDEDVDDEMLSSSQHQYQNTPKIKPIKPATITVQLSGGTVVIRRLKCGLLFVCVGPAQDGPGEHPSHLHPHDRSGDVSHVGSPGEADSMISTGAQTTASLESSAGTGAAAMALRRHAADLSRWLDDKLGTLTVPEEGVGVLQSF
ncbi:hypothetical protein G7Z17_g7545 [Cylindrodendrum hubeiense]|uniref:Uncharacterized protein n=1 Tax=Cylindrodendrum hubeiense TaxID=595255 RepID=A0A9P5H3J2_9HYPO|nr:hypothetical protein G7Z17_g7545 [Cylindrodendrum hubeiense]